MAKWFMIFALLAATALSSIGCAVGCYVDDDDDDYINTYLEFRYNGWWVSFPGGDDAEPYKDLICGWFETTGTYHIIVDASRANDSEYFTFSLMDTGYDLDIYYVGDGDVDIAYHYNGNDYEPSYGYVELVDIDPIGGEIEGYFGGYFVDILGVADDVLITDGFFRALRISDPTP